MKITQLHQIEMTSHCNLRCRYCPSRHLGRPKVHMTEEIFNQALFWAHYFCTQHGQREVDMAGIGESTTHPEFVRNMNLAREVLGPEIRICMATNGVAVTDEMIRAIAGMKPIIFVSMHRPEAAGPAIEILRKYGCFYGASSDAATAAIDWAGQVKWHVSVPARRPCAWLSNGMAMAMADGRVATCALDSTGVGVLGTLYDNVAWMDTSAYELCKKCDQLVPEGMTWRS